MSKKTNSSPCTFYIVRHGETVWNTQEILQGHMDSSLTEKGLDQAKEIARMFKDIPFVAVFSSDSLRAHRTAEIISLEHKLVVKTTQLLREKCFGQYEGKKVAVYLEELKDLLKKFDQLSENEQFKHKIQPDIESDAEVVTRFITFLREIAVGYAGKTVLVVTHGGMMRSVLMHLAWGTRKELQPNAVRNLGYIKLDSDGVDFFIRETHNVVKTI